MRDKGARYEELVREIMAASGAARAEAESIAAIELGLSSGCLVELDENDGRLNRKKRPEEDR